MSLLDQTSCSKMLYAEEVTATVDLLRAMDSKLSCTKIGSIDSILSTDSQHYPYRKQFNEAIHDPVVVLHSSGSTGKFRFLWKIALFVEVKQAFLNPLR